MFRFRKVSFETVKQEKEGDRYLSFSSRSADGHVLTFTRKDGRNGVSSVLRMTDSEEYEKFHGTFPIELFTLMVLIAEGAAVWEDKRWDLFREQYPPGPAQVTVVRSRIPYNPWRSEYPVPVFGLQEAAFGDMHKMRIVADIRKRDPARESTVEMPWGLLDAIRKR